MGKTKSSAFWWFMYHMQEQEYHNSGRVPTMAILNERAGNLWRQMSAPEKQPFIDKHEKYKAGPRPPLGDFASTLRHRGSPRGEPRREIKADPDAPPSRPESRSSTTSGSTNGVTEQSQSLRKKMTNALAKFIDEAPVETILKLKFHTISSNVMCATRAEIIDGCVTEDIYYPLEIGIAEFTLSDGITYEFNKFVDPGPMPSNMARICNEHALKHVIPLADFSCAKGCCKDPLTQEYIPDKRMKELDLLACDIHDLVSNSYIEEIQENPASSIHLVFSQVDQIYQNKGVLKTLGREAGCDHFGDKFEVIDVAELFFLLSRKVGFKLKAKLLDILDSTKYNFDGRCEFHATTDSKYCAITFAKNPVWLMLEHLSQYYGYEMTEKHRPKGEKKKVISMDDGFATWEGTTSTVTKRRYFDESTEPKGPIKQARTINWPESRGRGRNRIVNYDKPSSVPSSSSLTPFISTDVRYRDGRLKQETVGQPDRGTVEPIPGTSREDYRPRLPGAEPVASPFRTYEPQINDSKPKVPPTVPVPAPVTIGRGRGRNPKVER